MSWILRQQGIFNGRWVIIGVILLLFVLTMAAVGSLGTYRYSHGCCSHWSIITMLQAKIKQRHE